MNSSFSDDSVTFATVKLLSARHPKIHMPRMRSAIWRRYCFNFNITKLVVLRSRTLCVCAAALCAPTAKLRFGCQHRAVTADLLSVLRSYNCCKGSLVVRLLVGMQVICGRACARFTSRSAAGEHASDLWPRVCQTTRRQQPQIHFHIFSSDKLICSVASKLIVIDIGMDFETCCAFAVLLIFYPDGARYMMLIYHFSNSKLFFLWSVVSLLAYREITRR